MRIYLDLINAGLLTDITYAFLIAYFIKTMTIGSKFSFIKFFIYWNAYWQWYEKTILNNEFQPIKNKEATK